MAKQNTIEITIDGNNVTAVKAIDGTETKLKGLGKTSTKTGNELSNMLGNIAIAGTFTAIGSSIINTASSFEQLKTRLTSLYGGVDKATEVFEKFRTVAAQTPYSLEAVVEAGAQLKAFGMDAEKTLNSVADLAAYMGMDVVEAANAVGRAWSGGAGAADILRERGVLNLVKSFKGIEDITKLTLPEFRKALLESMQDPAAGIAGSTQRMSKTFAGALSNMQDSVANLEAMIGKGLLPTLSSLFQAIEKGTKGWMLMFGDNSILFSDATSRATEFASVLQKMTQQQLNDEREIINYRILETQAIIKQVEALRFIPIIEESARQAAGASLQILYAQLKAYQDQQKVITNIGNTKIDKDSKIDFGTGINKDAETKAKKIKEITDEINFKNAIRGVDEFNVQLLKAQQQAEEWIKTGVKKGLVEETLIADTDSIVRSALAAQLKARAENVTLEQTLIDQQYDNELKLHNDKIALWVNEQDVKDQFARMDAERKVKDTELEYAKLNLQADILGSLSDLMNTFYSTGGARAEAAFTAYKAFAVAQTMISTYAAAAAALQPPPIGAGPLLGGWLAAAVIASGLARVASIVAQRPSLSAGSGGGSSYSPSSSITNGSGAQAYANSVTNNNSTRQVNVTFQINGDVIDPDQWFRKNKSSIQKLLNDGIINFGSN